MGAGYIYVLTNPSFPEFIKIGYADDPERRLEELNRSECLPFAFRIYCTCEVPKRLADKDVHDIIDRLNPELRAVETFNGKPRAREFFRMSAEDAYGMLKSMAAFNDTLDRLKLYTPDAGQIADEREAEAAKSVRLCREEAVHAGSGASAEPRDGGISGSVLHVAGAGDASLLLEELRNRISAFGGVSVKPAEKDGYLSFYAGKVRFLAAERQKDRVKLYIKTKRIRMDDPKGLTFPAPPNPEGERQAFIANMAEIEHVIPLLRQAYEAVKA